MKQFERLDDHREVRGRVPQFPPCLFCPVRHGVHDGTRLRQKTCDDHRAVRASSKLPKKSMKKRDHQIEIQFKEIYL